MKNLLFVLVGMAVILVGASTLSLTGVNQVEGDALHTMQSAWLIADETSSAGTEPTALGEEERKKLRVDAAIAAAASGDEEISIFRVPSKWNAIQFRSANITKDTGSAIYSIYFGKLGGDLDCDLVYAGILTFTSGDQDSSYYQIGFTSGGAYVPLIGDIVTGNTSGETATIVSISALSSGAWADGDAAGTITYRSSSGTFTNSETVTVSRDRDNKTLNGLTHAASDLVVFEWADTLVITPKSWGSSWTTTTPADDTIAEGEIDGKGVRIVVIVQTTCNADSKLFITGY